MMEDTKDELEVETVVRVRTVWYVRCLDGRLRAVHQRMPTIEDLVDAGLLEEDPKETKGRLQRAVQEKAEENERLSRRLRQEGDTIKEHLNRVAGLTEERDDLRKQLKDAQTWVVDAGGQNERRLSTAAHISELYGKIARLEGAVDSKTKDVESWVNSYESMREHFQTASERVRGLQSYLRQMKDLCTGIAHDFMRCEDGCCGSAECRTARDIRDRIERDFVIKETT